jgi:membrane protease YdiL (CAAX protease family)
LHDKSAPGLSQAPHPQQSPSDDSHRVNVAPAGQPKVWSRIDRIRLFIWAGIAFPPTAALGYALHLMEGQRASVLTVHSELPFKALMTFFVALATWIVSRMEKRPLDDYGIPVPQAFGRRFWEGSIWGFAMLSAILLILWVSGHFRIDDAVLGRTAFFRWSLAWGATFLFVSLGEELAFRGYWLFTMSRRVRFWPAALFLSVVFGAAHLGNHGENVLGVLEVVGTGLLFCLMIRRTGNLWFAIGFHAAWDWAETFFYGTPDSGLLGVGRFLNSSVQGPNWLTGGSAGPEGSIFAIVILFLCALLIHLRFPKAIYPDRPV